MQLHSGSCRIRFPCPLSPGLAILFGFFFLFLFYPTLIHERFRAQSTIKLEENMHECFIALCTALLPAFPFKEAAPNIDWSQRKSSRVPWIRPKARDTFRGNGGTNERQLACQQAKCREIYMEEGEFEGSELREEPLCRGCSAKQSVLFVTSIPAACWGTQQCLWAVRWRQSVGTASLFLIPQIYLFNVFLLSCLFFL